MCSGGERTWIFVKCSVVKTTLLLRIYDTIFFVTVYAVCSHLILMARGRAKEQHKTKNMYNKNIVHGRKQIVHNKFAERAVSQWIRTQRKRETCILHFQTYTYAVRTHHWQKARNGTWWAFSIFYINNKERNRENKNIRTNTQIQSLRLFIEFIVCRGSIHFIASFDSVAFPCNNHFFFVSVGSFGSGRMLPIFEHADTNLWISRALALQLQK